MKPMLSLTFFDIYDVIIEDKMLQDVVNFTFILLISIASPGSSYRTPLNSDGKDVKGFVFSNYATITDGFSYITRCSQSNFSITELVEYNQMQSND